MSNIKDKVQAEALIAIGDSQLSGVDMSMGTGKTFLGIKHMCKHYTDIATFLVVAPKRSIFESWKKELIDRGLEELLDHITFVTYRSLPKMHLNYDVVYLDECHSLKQTYEPWLDSFVEKGGKILGLTGTYPIREWSEKGKLCNKFCPKVYTLSVDDAVDDSILNDYRIFVHKLTLNRKSTIEVKTKAGKEFTTSEYKNYEYWNKRINNAKSIGATQISRIGRMTTLQKMPSKEKYAMKLLKQVTKKTLVFTTSQAQADRLCEHSVHSKNKKSKENLQLFIDSLILKLSAVEQLSEGITIPGLETCIIIHSYGNNRRAAQKIGRALRLNPEETSTIHILCYVDTVDLEWVTSALENLDQSKINWMNPI